MSKSNARSKKSNFSNRKHETSQVHAVQFFVKKNPDSCSSSWKAHRLLVRSVGIAVCFCRQGELGKSHAQMVFNPAMHAEIKGNTPQCESGQIARWGVTCYLPWLTLGMVLQSNRQTKSLNKGGQLCIKKLKNRRFYRVVLPYSVIFELFNTELSSLAGKCALPLLLHQRSSLISWTHRL